ncbi:PAS domain S-box protein [Cyanobacteria bacterium FACHB-DQ100]|nr:PAS domain S-box protein [Cyanobacteria bacterium FACHB-DQ100]
MSGARRILLSRYGISVLVSLLALLIRFLLVPVLGYEAPLLVFIMPVMFAAWYGGLGPGLLATALSALVGTYFFVQPLYSLSVTGIANGVRIAIFLTEGVMISYLSQALITSKQRSEKTTLALGESEENYRLLVEGVQDYAIFLLDPNGKITTWNTGAEQVEGYSTSEVLGRHFSLLFPPEALEQHQPEQELQIATTEGQYKGQGWRRRKDGSLFWADVVLSALRDKQGNLRGFSKVTRDVTDRKAVVDALQENEQRFVTLAQASPAVIFQFNAANECIYINSRWSELTGYSEASALGMGWVKTFHPNDSDRLVREWLQWTQNARQHSIYQNEGRIVCLDGSILWYYIQALPLIEASSVKGYIGVLIDVTQRKQAEQAILSLNRELQRQLAESKTLLDVLPVGVGIAEDPQCEKIRVNSAFAQMLAIAPTGNASLSAPEGERPTNFKVYQNHQELAPEGLPLQRAAAEGIEIRDLELDIVWNDGTTLTLLEYAAPLFDEHGQTRGSIGAFLDITVRKQAEETLRKALSDLANVKFALDQAAILAITDAQGTITEVNDKFCELSKFSREELVGQNHRIINSGYHPKEFFRNLWATITKGEVWHGEIKNRAKDGTYYWVDTTIVPLLDEFDKPIQYLAVRFDITTRKQAEEALAKETANSDLERKRLRAVLDILPVGVFIADTNGHLLDMNPAARTLWGEEAPLLNSIDEYREYKGWWSGTNRRLSSQDWPLARTLREGRTFLNEEIEIETFDGQRKTILNSTIPIQDGAGTISSAVAVNVDITRRKQTEESLRRTVQRLETLQQIDRAILEATSSAAIADSALQRLNQVIAYQQAGVVLFNFEAQEAQVLAGKVDSTAAGSVLPITSLSPIESLQYRETVRYIEDLGSMLQRPPMLEYQFTQGTRSVLIVALLVERNLIGDLYLFAEAPAAFNAEHRAISQEIANQLAVAIQQARLREQLQQYTAELEQRVEARTTELQDANEALQAFTYSVSHDLRAPLRSMEGLGTILLEDYGDRLDEDGQEYTRRIVQAAQEMDTLILNLLDYSRLSRADIQLQALDLNRVVAKVVAHLQDDIAAKRAQVKVEPDLPNVMGHYITLSQILTNLLTNALKFTHRDRQPQIHLWVEERFDGTAEWVRLWVEDNGIGIEPRFQEQIFQVFERLHSAETYPGTGIGLAIVRKGVERMDGRVGVESQPGQGSRFWIELRKPPA